MTPSVSSYVPAISSLAKYAQDTHEWVVIIVPNDESARGLQKALTVAAPPGATLGGRTLLLPSGGRLTVSTHLHEVAAPGYLVMPLGFDVKMDPKDEIALHAWHQQSVGVITLGNHPGDFGVAR